MTDAKLQRVGRTIGTDVRRPVVFIGSSSESVRRGLLTKLASAMDDTFVVHRWDKAFELAVGKYTLEVLLDEAPVADAALLVFAQDDEREFRGERGFATRDNVILEYGLFLAELHRERVWIFEEEGVEIPSDVLGLTKYPFRSAEGAGQDADVEACVRAMKVQWGGITPRSAGDDANLGFQRTVEEQRRILTELTDRLHRFMLDGKATTEPVVLDSQSACITTYSEALERVKERLWTTTSLSSGFWTRRHPEVVAANEQMLRRLEGKAGATRRLFLLDQEPDQVREAFKAFRIQQRQLEKLDELEKVEREFYNLEMNTRAMLQDGMEVRVAFDRLKLYEQMLLPGMVSDPTDNELALYDRFRIDVFEGGRQGAITRVRTYSPLTRDFQAYLQATEDYFEELWSSADPIAGFLQELRSAVDVARAKIDYAPNWLAIYEFALDPEDNTLKVLELERVKEVLRSLGRAGGVHRYLDVGTCTGRYPIAMRDAVAPDGEIVGIDEDPDCVRFARANVERECRDDRRIRIEQRDFIAPTFPIAGPFDLITCMLGTIAHFGWDRARTGTAGTQEDQIQFALGRMAGLLSDDGLLMLGTWSEEACRRRQLLRIYRDSDTARLAAWTPPLMGLKERAIRAGLRVTQEYSLQERLDFLVCEKVH
jgi:predicted O-methyltransferase YrrM